MCRHSERDLPGSNTAGFNTTYISKNIPLESSDTLQRRMGIQHRRQQLQKRARTRSRKLIRAAGNNSNLLLNIGPYPNGEIDPQFVTRLKSSWRVAVEIRRIDLRHSGRPHPARQTGESPRTKKTRDLRPRPELGRSPLLASLPPIAGNFPAAQGMVDSAKMEFTQNADGVILKLPAPKTDRSRQRQYS